MLYSDHDPGLFLYNHLIYCIILFCLIFVMKFINIFKILFDKIV